MNKDQLKGKAENLKGRVKEAFGAVTGDKKKQASGEIDRAGGAVREKVGDLKEDLSKPTYDPDEGEHDE